jgi:hypothetical protein
VRIKDVSDLDTVTISTPILCSALCSMLCSDSSKDFQFGENIQYLPVKQRD